MIGQRVSGVLREIVLRREADLKQELASAASATRACRPPRSLKAAVSVSGRPAFILECKAKSPSRGVLVPSYDPAARAIALAPWCDALSVLTEPNYFGGSMEHIRAIRKVYNGVILAKDFFVHPRQVRQAWSAGADAILLMLSLLDDAQYLTLTKLADELGLEYVTEVHNRQELARALALGATIVGINNRDLGTLKVDLQTTRSLAGLVPESVTLISESGIRSYTDWYGLATQPRAVNAFLIGTSLAGDKPDMAARRLLFGPLKICGLTRPEHAKWAAAGGATYGGLIFVPASSREVTTEMALETVDAEPSLTYVGVFTTKRPQAIADVVRDVGLSVVQWHRSDLRPSDVQALRGLLPPDVDIWGLCHSEESEPQVAVKGCDKTVLEPRGPLPGGNGVSLTHVHPETLAADQQWVLAGGLGPHNIRYWRCRFPGVLDVNSQVEDRPGHKSKTKIADLFAQLLHVNEEHKA